MQLIKTVVAATAAVTATGGITLAAAAGSDNQPSQPGRTLPTVANSHAQEHAGPVLAEHPDHGQGHAYGRGHGTGRPAGVENGKPDDIENGKPDDVDNGKPDDVDDESEPGEGQGPPFSVPPAHGRPTATPPVPIPSHSHP